MKTSRNSFKRVAFWLRLIPLAITISICSELAVAGDAVMPPGANPHGTSLADMAEKLAILDSSGNNPAYYPVTAFRILFQDPAKQTGCRRLA